MIDSEILRMFAALVSSPMKNQLSAIGIRDANRSTIILGEEPGKQHLPSNSAQRALLVVLLVILFGCVKGLGWLEQALTGLFVKAHLSKHFAGLALLLLAFIKYSRPVLACFLTGVAARLERFQVMPNQFLKGQHLRVE